MYCAQEIRSYSGLLEYVDNVPLETRSGLSLMPRMPIVSYTFFTLFSAMWQTFRASFRAIGQASSSIWAGIWQLSKSNTMHCGVERTRRDGTAVESEDLIS